MYVCAHACMYVRMYVCMCFYHAQVGLELAGEMRYVCMCTCMHVCTYVCMHVPLSCTSWTGACWRNEVYMYVCMYSGLVHAGEIRYICVYVCI